MTLYVVAAEGDDAQALQRAVFIGDRFAWGALLFGPLWLLYRRLWLVLLAWIAAEVAVALLVLPHLPGIAALAVGGLAHLYLGFDGARLRQAKALHRSAFTGLVTAPDRSEAERRFFRRHLGDGADGAAA